MISLIEKFIYEGDVFFVELNFVCWIFEKKKKQLRKLPDSRVFQQNRLWEAEFWFLIWRIVGLSNEKIENNVRNESLGIYEDRW